MPYHRTDSPAPDVVTELATILAAGIIRLKSCPPELSANLSESTAQGLEFPAETRLSVVPRVNGRETARENAL